MMIRIRKLFNLDLKFPTLKMEQEYSSIKNQSAIRDHMATMGFLLIINILMIIPGLIKGNGIEKFIGGGSILILVILFALHKWLKKQLQLVPVLLLLSYNISRYFVIEHNYDNNLKGFLFFNGYGIASIQFIILSRLHQTQLKILVGFIGYALRIGVLMGIVDHRLAEPITIVRQFIIDAFIVYMFYSYEKIDRKVFQSYHENREELSKFKELLADSLPQSVTILDAKSQRSLFCNNYFLHTFSSPAQNQLDTETAPDNLGPKDDIKPSLSSLRVDIHTIRETNSTEGHITLKNFSSSSPYLEEVLELLVKENILDSKALSLTATYKHDNQHRLFEIIFKRIKWDRVEAVAVILNDITYQENLLTLKIANRNKDKMIATVSHELRTPLHGIIGVLQTMEQKNEGGESGEYLSLCKNHAYLLLSLVNSIVDFHQIKAGKLRLNPTKVNIRKVLRGFLVPFEFQCKTKGIQLEIEVNKDVPTNIITDENRLNQIFVNVMNNAVKFTFYGTIKIEATQDPKNINCLLISVHDTGVGIKEQDIGHLFKTWKALEDQESVGKSGVGLGLTMSNTLALLLNGRKDGIGIDVTSEYGKGSCFSFRLLKNLKENLNQGPFMQAEEYGEEDRRVYRQLQEKEISFNKQDLRNEAGSNESNYYERSDTSVDIQSKMTSYHSLRKGGAHDEVLQTNLFKSDENMPTAQEIKGLGRLNGDAKRKEIQEDGILLKLGQIGSEIKEEDESVQLFQKEHILVVDDYPFNLLVAQNLLKSFGYPIKVAMGGQEAIQIVKNFAQEGQTIKVILMDCQMPVMDGYEATRILIDMMNRKEIPRIPILAWTANNSEEDIQRCYDSGMVGHLSKPTSQEALKGAFEKLNKS